MKEYHKVRNILKQIYEALKDKNNRLSIAESAWVIDIEANNLHTEITQEEYTLQLIEECCSILEEKETWNLAEEDLHQALRRVTDLDLKSKYVASTLDYLEELISKIANLDFAQESAPRDIANERDLLGYITIMLNSLKEELASKAIPKNITKNLMQLLPIDTFCIITDIKGNIQLLDDKTEKLLNIKQNNGYFRIDNFFKDYDDIHQTFKEVKKIDNVPILLKPFEEDKFISVSLNMGISTNDNGKNDGIIYSFKKLDI